MTQPVVVALPEPAEPLEPDRPGHLQGSETPGAPAPAAKVSARILPALSLLGCLYLTLLATLGAWIAFSALVLGWRPVVLTGGSMEPSMRRGDVVMIDTRSGKAPGPGDIVVFQDSPEDVLTSHRVVAIDADGFYRTKGDANPSEDANRLPSDGVVGVGRLLVPLVGLPLAWWHGGEVLPVAAWGGLTVAAVAGLRPRRSPRAGKRSR